MKSERFIKKTIKFIRKNSFRLFLFFLTAVFILAVIPTAKLSAGLTFSAKLNHIAAFCVLMFFLEMSKNFKTTLNRVIFLFVYGVIIEFTQLFLPWRFFTLLDMAINLIGITTGYIFYRFFNASIKLKKNH
ncbi:MAG: VanZ family protein [Candidatus Muiribacteriota bacterium]